MSDFTVLAGETPVAFHARRWLLCGATWATLPADLQAAPWAAWRWRAGLLQCCSAEELPQRVEALMDAYPHSHLSVLAPNAEEADQAALRCCAADAEMAQRVSIVFDPATLRSLLTRPETECSTWLGKQGQVLLPQPQDPLSPEHLQEWQHLMQNWAQDCLAAVQTQAAQDLMDDLEAAENAPPDPQTVAALLAERTTAEAQLLYGLADDEPDNRAQALQGDWADALTHLPGANDFFYEPMALAASSLGASDPTSFQIDELQSILKVNLRHQFGHQAAVEVSFKTPPRLPAGTTLLRIELFDEKPVAGAAWPPLPLVVLPTADTPIGPWLVPAQQCPGIAQRFEAWLMQEPELKGVVWIGKPSMH